ncbi:MAG TPA: hypothetical protein VGK77_02495 [Candidatus Binatia bacterium]
MFLASIERPHSGVIGFLLATGSKRRRLKINVPALTAGDAQNLLTLRKDDDRCFSNAAAANTIRRYADNVFTGRNEKLDLFRGCRVCKWHGGKEKGGTGWVFIVRTTTER